MQCKTHLVECLNNIGVNVKVESSSIWEDNPKYDPKIALLDNKNAWFASKNEPESWWQIDFRRVVQVKSYLLMAGTVCAYTNKWYIFH